jgi:hypothetical protein
MGGDHVQYCTCKSFYNYWLGSYGLWNTNAEANREKEPVGHLERKSDFRVLI